MDTDNPGTSDAIIAQVGGQSNARAVANWLYNDWLSGYTLTNVAVYDFYNVLTSNGGTTNTNDLDWPTGNHHRWWESAEQHQQTVPNNLSAYAIGALGYIETFFGDGEEVRRSIVRWDLTGYLPPGSDVLAASVELYRFDGYAPNLGGKGKWSRSSSPTSAISLPCPNNWRPKNSCRC